MRLLTLLQLACLLGSGLIAGTFLAFSSFVMPALARLSTQNGIAAMQAINITVINPLFMAVLFGTIPLGIWAGYLHYQQGSMLTIVAAAVYALGVIGTTVAFNIPLNNQLAALDPASAQSSEIWKTYLSSWTTWNSLRGLAAAVSCVLVAL